MVKMPEHVWSVMVHNSHAMRGVSVKKAIADGMMGFNDEDWIDVNEKAASIKTGNHWYIKWKPSDREHFYVASACDLGKLLEYMTTVEYA